MRWTRAVVGASIAVTGCQRTVPEEFGHPPSTPAASVARSDGVPTSYATESTLARDRNAGRCVVLTPPVAPPMVSPPSAAECPADPEHGAAPTERAAVRFPEASGVTVQAEVARSEHDTMRGLMYRRSMQEDAGMLFDLHLRDRHNFWMHNTCIALDLVFLDFDGLIVGIVENAPTLNDESRGVDCLSRYVLEVNAGWARRHGVRAGQRVVLP